ncbi:aminotransferase class IV [Brevibacterium spongiae]|uniref:Aminotransferase class IV n=1 Tax=Brevibacterium spongiae TaxID=2909672 RepID=A0ABY5SMS0_9MICO|nr:aminotransferase class IV [Brevibacterium spongiae]UVI35867.1 aminotransferase class IV [Brevibacterium spongiae]
MTQPLFLVDPTAARFELTDLAAAQLPVTDLSAHRGDGIFETVLVSMGEDGAVVVNRERHFTRFRGSASALELPEPDQELWDRVIDRLIAEVAADDPGIVEFGIRYAMSRGEQDEDGRFRPRGWAFPVPVDDHIRSARVHGVTAVSLDRGFDAYIGSKAPWLLIGAKTLSYAVNQAAGRYAAAHKADEALFVSHDGIVLEGPTANLIIRRGDRLLTPDPEAGLLSGTTQQLIFDHAQELGLTADYADLRLDDVKTADGAWFVSSMRTAVALSELDGNAIAVDEELTAKFQSIVRAG